MNRNQKIGIGCGAAGCLGLLVVAVIGVGLYFYSQQRKTTTNRNSSITITSNTNSSSDDSSNANSSNADSSNSSEETPSSSMSNDDKHKLFQAAGMAGDTALTLKVLNKIGFGMGIISDYGEFVKDHISWSLRNPEFIRSVNTPETARAYVEAHLDD
jgi:hypothetical protein